MWLEGVHEVDEAGSFQKLGPGNAIVDIHVRIVDDPPMLRRICLGVVGLTRDGPLLVAYASLVITFSGINRCDHETLPLTDHLADYRGPATDPTILPMVGSARKSATSASATSSTIWFRMSGGRCLAGSV